MRNEEIGHQTGITLQAYQRLKFYLFLLSHPQNVTFVHSCCFMVTLRDEHRITLTAQRVIRGEQMGKTETLAVLYHGGSLQEHTLITSSCVS